jgi:pyruvate kinase
VATIGPACDDSSDLVAMVAAGMDVARLPLAHDDQASVLARLARVRQAADQTGRYVATMVDLPGPKLRLARIDDEAVLSTDSVWRLIPGGPSRPDDLQLGIELPEGTADALVPGTRLALGDGGVVLELTGRDGEAITAITRSPGRLRGRPGLHIPSTLVDQISPTPADLADAAAFAAAGVDAIAVSFVRRGRDIEAIRAVAPDVLCVAKIETVDAVTYLDEIIAVSDAVMVARGDLGLEFPLEEVPFLQKRIINAAIAAGRPAITATQMLESMITSRIPTRAEASDVANAVLDGSSAVMLSAETAVGDDPLNALVTLARLAGRADAMVTPRAHDIVAALGLDIPAARTTHAVSQAACRVADEIGADVIICLTESGFTARAVARFRPRPAIIAVTGSDRSARRLAFSWGVTPVVASALDVDTALDAARDAGAVAAGNIAVVVFGAPGSRATDSLGVRVVSAPEPGRR